MLVTCYLGRLLSGDSCLLLADFCRSRHPEATAGICWFPSEIFRGQDINRAYSVDPRRATVCNKVLQ